MAIQIVLMSGKVITPNSLLIVQQTNVETSDNKKMQKRGQELYFINDVMDYLSVLRELRNN